MATAARWELEYPLSTFAGLGDHTLDMAMTCDELVTSSRRWSLVWSDILDPRRIYFRGFYGWLGWGSPKHWNFISTTIEPATNDYEWHQEVEFIPEYVDDPVAHEAFVSIAIGESRTTWIIR